MLDLLQFLRMALIVQEADCVHCAIGIPIDETTGMHIPSIAGAEDFPCRGKK